MRTLERRAYQNLSWEDTAALLNQVRDGEIDSIDLKRGRFGTFDVIAYKGREEKRSGTDRRKKF